MGLEPIAWRGDQGQSPGDTAALPQFEMAATEFIFDASIGAFCGVVRSTSRGVKIVDLIGSLLEAARAHGAAPKHSVRAFIRHEGVGRMNITANSTVPARWPYCLIGLVRSCADPWPGPPFPPTADGHMFVISPGGEHRHYPLLSNILGERE